MAEKEFSFRVSQIIAGNLISESYPGIRDREVLSDLHNLPRHIDVTQAFDAVEAAYASNAVSFDKSLELRASITRIADVFHERLETIDEMKEIYGTQVEYYYEYCDEEHLKIGLELPVIARSELASLHRDLGEIARRCQEMHTKGTQPEEEAERLWEKRENLVDELLEIPTEQEVKLAKDEIVRETEHLHDSIVVKREKLARCLDGVEQCRIAREANELATLTAKKDAADYRITIARLQVSIPRIKAQCGLIMIEVMRLDEEFKSATAKVENLLKTLPELHKTVENLLGEEKTLSAERSEQLSVFTWQTAGHALLERKSYDARASFAEAKSQCTAITGRLNEFNAAYRALRQSNARQVQQNEAFCIYGGRLNMANIRVADSNNSVRISLKELNSKYREEEEAGKSLHQRLKQMFEEIILIKNSLSYGDAQLKFLVYKDWKRSEEIRKLRQAAIKAREDLNTLRTITIEICELDTKKINCAIEKNKLTSVHLQDTSVHHDGVIRTASARLTRKTAVLVALTRLFFKVDREKRTEADNARIRAGLISEHRDRLVFCNTAFDMVLFDFTHKTRLLANLLKDNTEKHRQNQVLRRDLRQTRDKHAAMTAAMARAQIHIHRLQCEFEVSYAKCVHLQELFESISARRAVDVSEYVTITLEHMLRSAEESLMLKHLHKIEADHHKLDKYVGWLHKSAQVDVKTLNRRLKWTSIHQKYLLTRRTLQEQLVFAAKMRQNLMNQLTLGTSAVNVSKDDIAQDNTETLRKKLSQLEPLRVTMEERCFSGQLRLRLLSTLTEHAEEFIQRKRALTTISQQESLIKRRFLRRTDAQMKLVMIDIADASRRLQNELISSENLSETKALATTKYGICAPINKDGSGDN